MKFYIPVILLLLLVGCQPQENATNQTSANPDIDNIFADWDDISTPGAALGVIQNGELIYAKGYGSADLEHDIPITPSSVFYLGSVSKQFVTFAILLLEEEGKLNLDDEIQVYLPDFPRYDSPLTIRNFIHHTSGVRDYLTLMAIKGRSYLDHITAEEVYELISKQKELNFTPGEKYLYSNSCYFMLSMIVEEASGQSLREYARENIFEPLEMNNSLFYDDNTDLIKNRVFSYEKTEDAFDNLILRFDMVGSGGVYSSIEDLVKWDQNFYTNKLGKGGQAIIEKMHEDGVLNNGESAGYAYAVVNGEYKGLRTVSHGGSLAGYRSTLTRFPDQQFSVIILANRSDANPTSKAYEVADYYLIDELKVEQPEAPAQEQASETLEKITPDQMTGSYEIEPGIYAEVTLQDDTLFMLQKWNNLSYPLLPVEGNTFTESENGVKFTFSMLENDYARQLTIDQNENETIANRIEDIDMTGVRLEDYAGDFYSDELDASAQIFLDTDTLYLAIGNRTPMTMDLYKPDQFISQRLQTRFQRDQEGINQFEIDAGRVTNLKFIRTSTK